MTTLSNEEIAKALNLFSAPVAADAVLDFYPNNYQSLKGAIERYKKPLLINCMKFLV
ncbi:MAG: hypothetical protein NTW22_01120 [Proteobacteria bacterium]|nr:hypothetical protein [Pseudomonadota bacterium]